MQSPDEEMKTLSMRMNKLCECGDELTMEHPVVCPDLQEPCTNEDLEEFNP